MKDEEAAHEEIVSLVVPPGTNAAGNGATHGTTARDQSLSPSPRRRRRRPVDQIHTMHFHEPTPSSSLMLRLTCLSVLTLVVIGSMGLLTYVQNGQTSTPRVYEILPDALITNDGDETTLANDHARGEYSSSPLGGSACTGRPGTVQLDKEALKALMDEAGLAVSSLHSRPPQKVYYNPQWTQQNPFDFQGGGDIGPNPLAPLLMSSSTTNTESSDGDAEVGLGYLQRPHLVQNQLVFCSQGNVFMAKVDPQNLNQVMPAAKLTTTVGNVLDPRLHPNLRYLAYTATYSGRRDIYLMDLTRAGRSPAVRLTYWDASVGVSGLIGWWGESSLLFQAQSNRVSLPDTRLYVLHLEDQEDGTVQARSNTNNNTNDGNRNLEDIEDVEKVGPTKQKQFLSSRQNPRATSSMLQIDAIPLSQARDAARYKDCWYFVRIAQTSHTIRYVGGTAEQLYRYCDNAPHTDRLLFHDRYNGTSKAPQMYPNSEYLFFLSDRGRKNPANNGGLNWYPDRMNVWALPLSDNLQDHTGDKLIQITDTSCDFEGRVIQEYSIDIKTGHMVLRIGADLYWMTADAIQAKLSSQLNRNRRTIQTTWGVEEAGEKQSPDRNSSPGYYVDGAIESVDDVNATLGENAVDQEYKNEKTNVDSKVNESPEGDTAVNEADMRGNNNVNDAVDMGMDDSNSTLGDDVDDQEYDNENVETASMVDDALALANDTVVNETVNKVYYHYEAPALESRFAAQGTDHATGSSDELLRLPIAVYSDFHTQQERLIPVDLLNHMTSADVYKTAFGSLHFVMTLRGQLWIAPVEEDSTSVYKGSGRNMPGRRYRVGPGATMGGVVRILTVRHVPNPVEDDSSDRRLAVILATDPLTETAEHAFYLIETQSSASPLFLDMDLLPKPFLGGNVSGGSSKDGGLGSVDPDSVKISPCGRRMAWTDRDGRIVVMNLPHYQDMTNRTLPEVVVLPPQNEIGQPMVGEGAQLSFSPGGRYLAIEHNARNQFSVISIADLGDPQGEDKVADIKIGRIVQATPDRFNAVGAYWGKSSAEMHTYDRDKAMAELLGNDPPEDVATTLFFLSDRDISSDVHSPWGTRQPMPHFTKQKSLFALPFYPKNATTEREGPFSGGGASELKVDAILARRQSIMAMRSATSSQRRGLLQNSLAGAFGLANDAFTAQRGRARRSEDKGETGSDDNITKAEEADDDSVHAVNFPNDMDIDFGPINDGTFTFARQAYRLATIPEANYIEILSQTPDDGSFVLIEVTDEKAALVVFLAEGFPSDQYTPKVFVPTSRALASYGRSTCGSYLFFGFSPDGHFTVAPNSGQSVITLLMDTELDHNVVSGSGLHLSVWPSLEYRQLYDDAWRMLRDYYYDPEMTGIDWPTVHRRFLPLVSRCTKREELDDVLVQMASELSALHVFVYGGEYDSPMGGDLALSRAHAVASLGATFQRAPEYKGYRIMEIPQIDPDFSLIDGQVEIYSPLSDKTLRLSGQRGLQVGDIIVGVNGESVMRVPDIHMLLRGMAGNSVRLDVLRLVSGEISDVERDADVSVETVIAVPITAFEADDLRYFAWEWKTRQLAEKLATENGFSVGYIHLQDMSGPEAEDAFARGFFPNYNKEAMILDVRHNRGGNIDSWVLDVLQRKPWMYWQSRDFNVDNGGLGWDEQFAFRGHLVVLLDEKTSSDGEGVSRGISELGLGRLVGTRTWGGGIWLASDNKLVDGGIATAPEIGTYNEHFGWGLGIEQMGVNPDIEVDNDPHETFDGKDKQLETAILELKKWLNEEPLVMPKPPKRKRDMTMGERECKQQ